MFRAGMTGMRLNLSHVGLAQSGEVIETYHAAARRAGVNPRLIIDMQGPELRVGVLAAPVPLREGETAILGESGIPVPDCIFAALERGMEILLDDGAFALRVDSHSDHTAVCTVLRGGMLQSRKGLAVPGAVIRPPAVTDFDLRNIAVGAQYGVTGILQPFCTGKADLIELRGALDRAGLSQARIMAKVENRAGVDALEELIAHADEICIARGDLGNDMPLWMLPATQKRVAAACNRAGCPFSVSTQMLHSMIASAVPTRAEVSDIFNAVLDGASALLLTGETAVGRYPVESMHYLCETARQAIQYRDSVTIY